MFYKLVEEFSDIITEYNVFEYRRYGSAASLVASVEFKDRSLLYIKDYIFIDGKRKYSYHWQDAQGRLIIRWDNSPHHKGLPTFPLHKHLPDEVAASRERTIKDVLTIIKGVILPD
ncbi:MAG: hypothetical protein KKA79_04970 [Nanoarchaeota archaeon]|nr:hypothetical protein [Nanoarchaeota archaeon]MCG2727155.1 DUF6516 family protein [Candidatus Methanoperedenaceae archaeon]